MHTLSKIKICGIKTLKEIEIINKYPVDFIGFIFAKSKRQVTPEVVAQLRRFVRKDIKVVGVFVNESIETINAIIEKCQLDVAQLHGEESIETCKTVKCKIWKSFSVRNQQSLQTITSYSQVTHGILLDTYTKVLKGGTGKTFDWKIVKDFSKRYTIILAGGLNPNNIQKAMLTVNPQVLDINSGVETHLLKDENKIKEIFKALGR